MAEIDIIIPIYDEGPGLIAVIAALHMGVKTSFSVLICYDHEEETALPYIPDYCPKGMEIRLIKNRGTGVHDAIMSGFAASSAPAVVVYPADDTFNARLLDPMYARFCDGAALVSASRFIPGGCMKGCPWLKEALVRSSSLTLYHLAKLPSHDASNGFRLFSRRLLDRVKIESTHGFSFSIELLVKCHRLGWRVDEVPAIWLERTRGESRFRVLAWLPAYLRWYRYAFETTYFNRGPETMPRNEIGVDTTPAGI